jgi:hypothetical protein
MIMMTTHTMPPILRPGHMPITRITPTPPMALTIDRIYRDKVNIIILLPRIWISIISRLVSRLRVLLLFWPSCPRHLYCRSSIDPTLLWHG